MEKVAGRKEWKKTSDRGCINTNGISRGGISCVGLGEKG